jgi:hypothetical protein
MQSLPSPRSLNQQSGARVEGTMGKLFLTLILSALLAGFA